MRGAPEPEQLDAVAEVRRWVSRAGATPWPELLRELREAEETWGDVTDGLSQPELDDGRRDGGWTIADVLAHVGSDLHGFAEGLAALAAGEAVGESVFSPRWPGVGELTVLRSGWALGWAALQESARAAARSSSTADARFQHDILGPLERRELAGLALWHADDHSRQLRAMRRGAAGSGAGR